MYIAALKPDGLLLVHVSNRYLRLSPVVGAISAELHLDCLLCTVSNVPVYQTASTWIAVGRPGSLRAFQGDPAWEPVKLDAGIKAWTDDYSNVMSALIWKPKR